ncbi:MAG: GNAT family N-acetyltransferase [Bdellovibrionales bacterium]|nr:GNAT family N-acetyltransferase [Bdellovibrionales bacterium]
MSDFHLPTFETSRLKLRHFTEDDFSFMRELDTDPSVVKYLGHGQVRSEEETKKNLNKLFADYEVFDIGLYLVEDKVSGEKLGRAGLIPWNVEGELYWEVGYTFKPSAWGKGYATEAATYLALWGQENLNTDYLVSFIHPENLNSIHVASKVGLNYWKNMTVNGHDICVYRTL